MPRFLLPKRRLCSRRRNTSLNSKSTRSQKLSHLLPNPAKNHNIIVDEARLRSVLSNLYLLPLNKVRLWSLSRAEVWHWSVHSTSLWLLYISKCVFPLKNSPFVQNISLEWKWWQQYFYWWLFPWLRGVWKNGRPFILHLHIFLGFFLEVEISSCALIPLYARISPQWLSELRRLAEYFLTSCMWAHFLDRYLHYTWTAA